MTVIQRRTDNPVAHLTEADIENIGRELDEIRAEVFASLNAEDAKYIRRVIKAQRLLEMGSRGALLFSLFPPAWIAGTVGLSVAKILENMEIGHNILHGQWDWMRDPKIHSTTWEWDNAAPADMWKHSHNEIHHNYTNVVGRDNDLGYGIMRVDEDQRWTKATLGQPVYNVVNMIFFEYSIAAYDLELGAYYKGKKKVDKKFKTDAKRVLRKIGRQMRKDFVLHPALAAVVNPLNAIPAFLATLTANAVASLARNVWTHSVIMCGHFPEGVATFSKTSIDGETKGEWYVRQMVGSANISGGPATHMMTGNLSFQIEHHLFPDMPSTRYKEISPKIQDLFERYNLPYVTGSLPKQVGSAWGKVFRLALPNNAFGRFNKAPAWVKETQNDAQAVAERSEQAEVDDQRQESAPRQGDPLAA